MPRLYPALRRKRNIVRRGDIRPQATLDHCPVKPCLHFCVIPFPIKFARNPLLCLFGEYFSARPSENEQRRGKAFPPPPTYCSLPYFAISGVKLGLQRRILMPPDSAIERLA